MVHLRNSRHPSTCSDVAGDYTFNFMLLLPSAVRTEQQSLTYDQCHSEAVNVHNRAQVEGGKAPLKGGKLLSDYMVQQPRRQPTSQLQTVPNSLNPQSTF
jgi:hypothetical protein